MNNQTFLYELQNALLPKHYKVDLSEKVADGCLLFKKGAYISLVMPFADVPQGDYGSKHAKSVVQSVMTCLPVIMEKGLFLIYYGDESQWKDTTSSFKVDKTALRPIILQSIHFIDPTNGANVNSRTHWGPLKFDFFGNLIADIQSMAESIQQGAAPNP